MNTACRIPLLVILCLTCLAGFEPQKIWAADDAPAEKPKVAVFPISGGADQTMRDKVGLSLRMKLDRSGTYDVIDGPTMADFASAADGPITLAATPDKLKALVTEEKPVILIWGEMEGSGDANTLKLKIVDLRDASPSPREITKSWKEPTEVRFALEQILQTLRGMKPFEHPNEISLTDDPRARELWAKNPNLVINGDFAQAGHWDAIYQSELYPVQISSKLPETDKVNIFRIPDPKTGAIHNVLAMKLSLECAQNNGMACLSDLIKIEPNTRYRLSFRYKSDGPSLHVFVKGYTRTQNIKGEMTEREVYRRQVPPSGATGGKWVTVVDDMNPQHVAFPVQFLRVDLYAYLGEGTVMFDDVVLKNVGAQTHQAHDAAIKRPTTSQFEGHTIGK